MNSMQMTEAATQMEDMESSITEEFETTHQSAQPASCTAQRNAWSARLRYTLLVGIVLYMGWLTYITRNTLNELNTELESIRVEIATFPLVRGATTQAGQNAL